MKFIKKLFFNTNNDWKKIDWNKVPSWVKKEWGKNCPGPVSRPPHFSMQFRGRNFRYKVIYDEINSRKTNLVCYRKRSKNGKRN